MLSGCFLAAPSSAVFPSRDIPCCLAVSWLPPPLLFVLHVTSMLSGCFLAAPSSAVCPSRDIPCYLAVSWLPPPLLFVLHVTSHAIWLFPGCPFLCCLSFTWYPMLSGATLCTAENGHVYIHFGINFKTSRSH